MTSLIESPQKDNGAKPSDALAGAGGGTLLILLARQLAESNPYKPYALLLAPSLSVLITTGLLWLRGTLRTYYELKSKDWLFNRVQSTFEKCLDNPRTSVEHKEKLRKQLEELETARAKADLQLILEEKIEPGQVEPS
jgi:hypothetical protein